jgi:hypothetical protein
VHQLEPIDYLIIWELEQLGVLFYV